MAPWLAAVIMGCSVLRKELTMTARAGLRPAGLPAPARAGHTDTTYHMSDHAHLPDLTFRRMTDLTLDHMYDLTTDLTYYHTHSHEMDTDKEMTIADPGQAPRLRAPAFVGGEGCVEEEQSPSFNPFPSDLYITRCKTPTCVLFEFMGGDTRSPARVLHPVGLPQQAVGLCERLDQLATTTADLSTTCHFLTDDTYDCTTDHTNHLTPDLTTDLTLDHMYDLMTDLTTDLTHNTPTPSGAA